MKCTGVAGRAFPDGEFFRRNPVISVVRPLTHAPSPAANLALQTVRLSLDQRKAANGPK